MAGDWRQHPGAVVVNPASAGWATGRRWPRIEAVLRERGLRFTALVTERAGQAGELALHAMDAGAGWILVVGGDGTFNEVVNGLADAQGRIPAHVALGFIPSGTGLDLARNLELPLNAVAAARVVGRTVRRLDLGCVRWEDGSRRLFANMGGAGFDGEVARQSIPWRRVLPGKLAYAAGIMLTAPAFRERELELELAPPEGAGLRSVRLSAKMVVAANGASFGGGMRLVPDARMDDGLLDVFILGPMAPLELLAKLPRVYQGTHLDDTAIQVLRVRWVRLRADAETHVQTDGEPVGVLPALFEVVPDALTVLT
jgi:diacylglycerol kinase (ATP)